LHVTLIIVAAALLVALVAILVAVHRTRPESLKLSATITRWCSVTLEITLPRPDAGRTTQSTSPRRTARPIRIPRRRSALASGLVTSGAAPTTEDPTEPGDPSGPVIRRS